MVGGEGYDPLLAERNRRPSSFGRADVAVRARRMGLGQFAEGLAAFAEWGACVEPVAGTAARAPGGSKIGGVPDLPPGVAWPSMDGRPATFVAQIALSDAAFASPAWRDSRGATLYFYCHRDRVHDEVIGARVFVGAAPNGGEATADPPDVDLLPESAIRLRPELELPAWGSYGEAPVHGLGLDRTHRERYETLVASLEAAQGIGPPRHRLLGHPSEIRDDVLVEAALMARFESGQDAYGREDLEAEAQKWRLLLRIDTDGGLGVSWAGGGANHFCIRATHLRAGRYDETQAFVRL